jgi:ectoine hydroxylase-related dioxygenase (phytanoyl-CoA dioxygenase family)
LPENIGVTAMIGRTEIEFYREHGYLVVPDILSADEIARARAATDRLVEDSRKVTQHTDIYDLEPVHTPSRPAVRRIKTPHKFDPAYQALAAHPRMLEVLKKLIGPSIRFDTGKLNMKSAGVGSEIEWHQDWAFYPHTNDDLAAVGYMIDDVDLENGPMLVLPGSHKGPVYDHHVDGVFCGAMAPSATGLDFSKAVPLMGKAGSITVHHVRAVHGSAQNTSARQRRFLLFQYSIADAWPLRGVEDFAEWCSRLLCGEETFEPRLEKVPVRVPYPIAAHQGSIYENQRAQTDRYFAKAAT